MSVIMEGIAALEVLVMVLLADGAMEALGLLGFGVYCAIGLGVAVLFLELGKWLDGR